MGFFIVEYPVGAGIGLDQPVVFEVFIDIEGIEGGAVEAGEEHVDHEQDIDLTVFHPFADVLVIVVKAPAVFGGEFGVEHFVVVMDDGFELIAAVGVDG